MPDRDVGVGEHRVGRLADEGVAEGVLRVLLEPAVLARHDHLALDELREIRRDIAAR